METVTLTKILQILITIILIGVMPIRIILEIEKKDDDLPKLNKKDRIYLYAVTIIEIVILILTFDKQNSILYTVSIVSVTAILNITSYMDEKIQSFHRWICLVGIGIQLVLIALNKIVYNQLPDFHNIVGIIILLAVMLITSIAGGLGLGDLLLYMMISISYIMISPISYIVVAIDIVLSYLIFLIKNIMFHKKLKESNPYTLSLAIMTFIINSIIWII